MMKYILPPLLALLCFLTFSIILEVISNPEKYARPEATLGAIAFIIAMTVLGYPIALIIHLIGCLYIKVLKEHDTYNLKGLLIAGFCFGVAGATLYSGFHFTYIGWIVSGGLAGMIACWLYYFIDAKQS